jgi:hypothetical protein
MAPVRWRSAVVNGLLMIVAFGVAFAVVEVGLRAFFPQQLGVWYSLRNGLVIHPPGTRIHLANFGQDVRFNSLGMRDVEHATGKEPGTFRILLLGDSFLEALQVGLDDSFPRLLEKTLNGMTGQRIEVINCAVGGWGTDSQLEYLSRYGLSLKPDLIVVAMTLHNDVSDNLEERFHALVDGRAVPKPSREMPGLTFGLLKVKDYLASRSHTTQLVRRHWYRRTIRTGARQLDSHVLQLVRNEESAAVAKGWALTHELLLGVRQQGAGAGARTAAFLIPLSIQLYEDSLRVFLEQHGVTAEEISIARPQEIMRRFGATARLDVIDLLPDSRRWIEANGGTLHVWDGHWNVDGHRLAAAIVSEELIRRELLPSPVRSSLSRDGEESSRTPPSPHRRGAGGRQSAER